MHQPRHRPRSRARRSEHGEVWPREERPVLLETGKASPGSDRVWAGPAGTWTFFPQCDVNAGATVPAWKLLPAIGGGIVEQLDLAIDEPRLIAAVEAINPDGWGEETSGIDIAVADLNASGHSDAVVFYIDNPGGGDKGYVCIGSDLDNDGHPQTAWQRFALPLSFGNENQGAGFALTELTFPSVVDAFVFRLDHPAGGNHGWYAVGTSFKTDGSASWSEWREVPGPFGDQNAGAAITIVELPERTRPALLVLYVDAPDGPNAARYRVGFDLDADGRVAGGWSPWIEVPGFFGDRTQGVGAAVADLSGNGTSDFIVFHVDDSEGANQGYWRVGWTLGKDGSPQEGWTLNPEPVPGFYGSESQGAGVAACDFTRNGRPDLIFAVMDNPQGSNSLWYSARAT